MKDVLIHSSLLINLPPKTIEAIAEKVVPHTYQAGDVVLEREQINDTLFFILKGRVEVLMQMKGREIKISELGPADAFGEMSFIDNFITSGRVRAIEPCEIGQVGRHDVMAILKNDPVSGARFWETLCQILIRRYWILLEQTYKIFREYFKSQEKP